MSKAKPDQESVHFIHQRYQDTALVIFQRNQKRSKDFGPRPLPTPAAAAESTLEYSHLGNQPVRIQQAGDKGMHVSDAHDDRVQSQFCIIM